MEAVQKHQQPVRPCNVAGLRRRQLRIDPVWRDVYAIQILGECSPPRLPLIDLQPFAFFLSVLTSQLFIQTSFGQMYTVFLNYWAPGFE